MSKTLIKRYKLITFDEYETLNNFHLSKTGYCLSEIKLISLYCTIDMMEFEYDLFKLLLQQFLNDN